LLNCDVTGKKRTGCVCGINQGVVTQTTADCDITGQGWYAGGLVGRNAGTVSESSARGTVTGDQYVGGLAGIQTGEVQDSVARCDVTGEYSVGGLCGHTSGVVKNSHYNVETVKINGDHQLTVGGLFDEQYQDWQENDRHLDITDYDSLERDGETYTLSTTQGVRDALGFTQGPGNDWKLTADIDLRDADSALYIPYLAGDFDGNDHTITIDIQFVSVAQVGFIGINQGGDITAISVAGEVSGVGPTGGLVGTNRDGVVRNSSASVDVEGSSGIGGLIGSNGGRISNSSASGNVGGVQFVGGLVGSSSGEIAKSAASGDVLGEKGDFGTYKAGGLVGWNQGSVTESFASGAVTGEGFIGGLVGKNGQSVQNSYASGDVTGNDAVGGLVGQISYGTVETSFATGSVTGESQVGGVAGDADRGVTGAYWNSESTGQDVGTGGDTDGVTDLTTEEMQGESAKQNMDALDFETVWTTVTDPADYPQLLWEPLESSSSQSDTAGSDSQGESDEDDTPESGSDAQSDEDGTVETETDGASDEDGTVETETDELDEDDASRTDEEAKSGGGDDGFGPGFGIGSALAGCGGLGYLLKRRHSTEESGHD
jgi:hypothetical protein